MATKTQKLRLEGTLNVAYRRHGREFSCTALQFDIFGTGKTYKKAFDQMQALLEDYIVAVAEEIHKGTPVRFFNLSDPEEWERALKIEAYFVTVDVDLRQPSPAQIVGQELKKLRHQDLGEVANKIKRVKLEKPTLTVC